MAATPKTHYVKAPADRPVCGQSRVTFVVRSDRKMAHTSGRLMTAGEAKAAARRIVTCAGCLARM